MIQCQCGAVSQNARLRKGTPLSLCHCNTCRHLTGLLCTSYYPVEDFHTSDSIRVYSISARSNIYFCTTCGCHVARSRKTTQGPLEWDVATGVVVSSTQDLNLTYESHKHVQDTQDGGISTWIDLTGHRQVDQHTMFRGEDWLHQEDTGVADDLLHGSCACGTVRFEITRPDSASREPSRWLPDLTFPDKTTPDSIKQNPSDLKWWIPNDGSKFLAGTCVCRSCRLISGFEIQTWAFVPRSNISFLVPGPGPGQSITQPLDFSTLPRGILQTHSSSPNVLRDFCGKCGATVFWREKGKPDVLDVSVGLFQAREGARAESWLEWWTDRVSFSEEVGTGRTGSIARTASNLVQALEDGLKVWKHRE
ncbi:uncharacterized protein TRIVIDRAFT_29138 [Trichoderma virens Gv29-8]|uniref:CENP-V/GFA domain-containing protein n=1 Tax=Hypocrea virens (strain Gv29-8 / FGSC 10586) TaxID=413071 RepID=G9MSX8_HYPVG|nr:uncharacterized protein TRIVIDRAFT_29138 [Trichoderma virens Gv29-8]EHK23074.1 hypothetical protein TRIVIDRAFT_29138 [Trichoderma virens Gv29-8]